MSQSHLEDRMAEDKFLSDAQLKKEILKHIENETFVLTKHAAEEQKNDEIDMQDTLHVLKTGRHEKEKTGFDTKFQGWKYAIKGKTEDLDAVRVIIAFQKEMMIITVIKLEKKR
jgi:phage terminase large subunit-like protein